MWSGRGVDVEVELTCGGSGTARTPKVQSAAGKRGHSPYARSSKAADGA